MLESNFGEGKSVNLQYFGLPATKPGDAGREGTSIMSRTSYDANGLRQFADGQVVDVKPTISVVGLGYVGAVSVGCLARLGFQVIGVDVAADKVDAISEGRAEFVESGLQELLRSGLKHGLIRATEDLIAAVRDSDVTLLSVGTPTAADGGCDLSYVRAASVQIGAALASKPGYHTVVLRCSVPPGTTLDVVVPEIEKASGKTMGRDFGICFNPEFLREGVAVDDFQHPARTVIGASDERAARVVQEIFASIDAPIMLTSIAAAEMVKYLDNVWHATKVVFANEAGRICKSLGIDSHVVMNLFVADTKLNISPTYLRPGFAFGGSCLPKEVRAVRHLARMRDLSLPLIESLMPSNRNQIEEAVRLLEPFKGRCIGILGLAFKPGTDDLRESPALALIALLRRQGARIAAFDPNLSRASLEWLSHGHAGVAEQNVTELLVADGDALMAACDVVVVTYKCEPFRKLVRGRPPHVHVLDLARLEKVPPAESTYAGIAW